MKPHRIRVSLVYPHKINSAGRAIDPASEERNRAEESSVKMASVKAGRALSPQKVSAYWADRAREFVLARAAAAAGMTVRKLALVINIAEVTNHLNFDFMRSQAGALARMPVGFGVVFALTTLGAGSLLRAGRRRSEALLLLLFVAGSEATKASCSTTWRKCIGRRETANGRLPRCAAPCEPTPHRRSPTAIWGMELIAPGGRDEGLAELRRPLAIEPTMRERSDSSVHCWPSAGTAPKRGRPSPRPCGLRATARG